MGTEHPSTGELFAAFRDLASGRGVRRGRHCLTVEADDETPLFVSAMEAEGFAPTTVREAPVEPGQRAPAFALRAGFAEFGWVFWEKFREGRSRKLFGSARRNAKGDWDIQIGIGSPERIHVKLGAQVAVDSDRPSDL